MPSSAFSASANRSWTCYNPTEPRNTLSLNQDRDNTDNVSGIDVPSTRRVAYPTEVIPTGRRIGGHKRRFN
jgi:hypothetical protein